VANDRPRLGVVLMVCGEHPLYGELLEALSELIESPKFRPLEISWTAAAPVRSVHDHAADGTAGPCEL
jgi:hypothetical protein